VKSIDPATGQVQTVVTTGLPTAAGQGVSAFDVSGRRLFFLSFSGVNEPSLAIVNVDTHAVTTRPLPSIGSLAYFLFEFGAALSVAVPAAQPLSLGFMTAGLLLVAAWFLRRAAIDPR
jgi:hypothetical protein